MHLLVYLRYRFLISLRSCLIICILASLHPHVLKFICSCLHSCMFISSGLCVFPCILASSHPHILRFICACWYTPTLTSLYHQVHVCLLVCLHTQINLFLIRMNDCILVSSDSSVRLCESFCK